ncbi:sporulation-specific diadenylate cyclase CdaS [Paenactinomyces guangxiensis]|uniref:Diadenylate cyclase n=1 Tax=Paenactinomyces guangxiensis TaxID=1490290 RepID=A0A7W1WT96_9BACL|nr:sporulation-specific diadenylate cyclase CdaS [Paenactinomyces guangxiensis]MBA4495655.1 DNA integrity scanning protein DisA nucleotide-binding domain protein [Paenactinomyces guangxiensis]MBH8592643.1 DNA integrity scanning protein DisA nucleotide-binding domain protein [Paenactinomyces guangxiensis]
MKHHDCDFSPLKLKLKEQLTAISGEITKFLGALDNEGYCLLSEFAAIRGKFAKMESIASSFYLYCYLSPFTDKYVEISESVQHLSDRKHGALIVIERQDPLGPLLNQGTPLNATFTSSLLESIFYPGSPLHDGALLLRGDLIVSAAHILPLSIKKIESEHKLGTRHRAALGLTERSDALVIVVSEETGRASFALHGKLYPLNARELYY